MTEQIKQRVYAQMISELDARIRPLQLERANLLAAANRIAEIDTELAVLNTERAEYDALVPKPVEVVAA